MITRTPFHSLPGFEFLEIETEHSADLLSSLPEKGLGVVGTRYPQRRSFEFMEKTIAELRGTDRVIVSGFARGIDSRAHELAIEHGLKTIAILGCGLNIDYPSENRILRRKILESGGMIISPFEADAAALPRNFLHRNQLIAYFSKAIWVVEAAAISGTLNTATHAGNLNRDLYATPCFPDDSFFEGNQNLLSQQHSERYPVAEPLFGAFSLNKTWTDLISFTPRKKSFDRRKITKIQKWVLALKEECGECRLQSLMNHAINSGMSPGQFYEEFREESERGRIIETLFGTVDLP